MSKQNISITNSSSSGIGFVGALTILFIALKLLDKIDWSWWWVLSPILIIIGFVLIFLLAILIIIILAAILDD